ncbi:MAG TPA: DNA polymerase III subunit delta, partial [Catalimonadaceae bacterium]|nr:DNA polymerase III subunit delta [Catalimonadaceae bacterium]
MAQTPQTVLDELKKGIYRPLYFLQGEEPFYIDQIARYIEENALAESERGFNQLIMYGKDQTI